jgi:hypothetical protein
LAIVIVLGCGVLLSGCSWLPTRGDSADLDEEIGDESLLSGELFGVVDSFEEEVRAIAKPIPYIGLDKVYSNWNSDSVVTISFDPQLSEEERDRAIVRMSHHELLSHASLMQRTKGVVSRSVTQCFFTSADTTLTWSSDGIGTSTDTDIDTDIDTDLLYVERLFDDQGSVLDAFSRQPVVSGERLSFGDKAYVVLTVKNKQDSIVQIGDGSSCAPIAPQGYARLYIQRPRLLGPQVQWEYGGMSGVDSSRYLWLRNDDAFESYDSNALAFYSYAPFAFPQNSILTFSGFVSWSHGMSSEDGKGRRIESPSLGVKTTTVSLVDNRWGRHDFELVIYDRLVLKPVSILPSKAKDGYFWWFVTQHPQINVDVDRSNSALESQFSGVVLRYASWPYPWFVPKDADGVCRSGNCFVIEARLQRGERVDRIMVMDRFGLTGSVLLNFSQWVIKPSLGNARVRGESMNILSQAQWQNHIEVDYENITDSKVSYFACRWRPLLDIENLDRRAQTFAQVVRDATFPPNSTREPPVARLEDLLFTCDKSPLEQPFISATTRYRDPQTIRLPVPSALSWTKAFAVRTPQMAWRAPLFFVQTQLGIVAKQTSHESILWLFDLQTWKPITGSATLQFYHLDPVQGWHSSGSIVVSSWPYRTALTWWSRLQAVTASVGDAWGFVTLAWPWKQWRLWLEDRTINLQSAVTHDDVAWSSQSAIPWWREDRARVYGYTDRGLYKPWDSLHVVWWYRALADIGKSALGVTWVEGAVYVRSLLDYQSIPFQKTGMLLDKYGGFGTSFLLPKTLPVGPYSIEFVVRPQNGQTPWTEWDGYWTDPFGGVYTYTQNISVEEYQKPTFFVRQDVALRDDALEVTLQPEYYFGAAVQWWNHRTERSIADKLWWWWRWAQQLPWDNPSMYYDVRLESDPYRTQFGNVQWIWTNQPKVFMLWSGLLVPGMSATLKVASSITDVLSNETRAQVTYTDINPLVRIGFSGRPYERYYADSIKNAPPIQYVVTWWVRSEWSSIPIDALLEKSTTTFSWYYADRSSQWMSVWVDGSLYYNGMRYALVSSGSLPQQSGRIDIDHITSPWSWLLIVETIDAWGRVLWRNEQLLWYASGEGYNWWPLNNTYTLTVDIPAKSYDEGEAVPINISPYIPGATVLVTIEQWPRLLDSFVMTLDGWPLEIPAKVDYFPSVVVGVTQVAGYDQVNAAATGMVRREPRFWQGYSQIMLNRDLYALQIEIKTDKPSYEPWETMRLHVTTKDHTGKLVDARLSVAVVDEALNDLYRYFKEPLADFFLSMGTTWVNYTNLKWLYQWLKIFTQEWWKWWAGWSRNPLWFLREKFEDVAYRSGQAMTQKGVWKTDIVLPDNLTTWSVDVMGITLQGQMGNRTERVIVAKDVLVKAHLPLYVTLGDALEIPVSAVAVSREAETIMGESVSLVTTVSTPDGQRISSQRSSFVLWERVLVPLHIDQQWYSYENVVIEFALKVWSYRDASKHVIPLRTQWLMVDSWKSDVAKQGTQTHLLLEGSVYPTLQVSLAPVPLMSINNQLDYLLDYSYGGTEPLVSSVVALLTAKELTNYGLFTDVFSGDMVVLPYRTPFSSRERIVESVSRIWENQQEDGGLSAWWRGSSSYLLSAYVYGMMTTYYELIEWYEDRVAALSRYLEREWGADNQDAYLYYLSQKARVIGSAADGWVALPLLQSIVERDGFASVPRLIFGAVAAFYIGEKEIAKEWLSKLSMDDFVWRQHEFGSLYPLLTPRVGMVWYQEMKRALASTTKEDNDALLVWLMRQRGRDGLWWWSGIDNLAALRLMATVQSRSNNKAVRCSITHEWRTQTVTVLPIVWWSGEYMLVDGATSTDFSWTCADSIVVDTQMRGVMPSFTWWVLASTGVEYLSWRLPASLNPGELWTARWAFKISSSAEHVGIEFFVPATYALRDILYPKKTDLYALPFSVHWWWGCTPTYYEMRFDRVFLYYEMLESNAACRIDVPMLRSFSWTIVPLPSRLFQLYDDRVGARAMPTSQ